nr:immunoglobulin heavy chain junction region [Mus musculus]
CARIPSFTTVEGAMDYW